MQWKRAAVRDARYGVEALCAKVEIHFTIASITGIEFDIVHEGVIKVVKWENVGM